MLSVFSAFLLIFFLFGDQNEIARKSQALAADIRISALITGLHTGHYHIDPTVLRAMAQVPRHDFISPPLHPYAYQNVALPLAEQNYILPEPFLTALMIDCLNLDKNDHVLDIGYGAGYSAAIMSQLAGKVFVFKQRGEVFDDTLFTPLEERGYGNIASRTGNGLRRWRDNAPFDAILVRGALPGPPAALLDQLKPGGRMVAPVGPAGGLQQLTIYEKDGSGAIKETPMIFLKIAPLFPGHEI